MSSLQNVDMSLQDYVKNIKKDTYLIPKFQRDFVWNRKDIVELGDSIIRGYPISSLLTMPENGNLQVGSHPLVDERFKSDSKENSDQDTKQFILDGQQRTTSIAKIFCNFDSNHEFYFDLLAILEDEFPNDKLWLKFSSSTVNNNKQTSKIADSLCKDFPVGKDTSEKPTRQNNRFISGSSIINNKFGSVVTKFLRNFDGLSDDDLDKYTDYLNGMLGSVSGYSIPVTMISGDSQLGVVVRVFEKVNSTGKKLTLFDLINAKSFQVSNPVYSGGLSDYLTNKLISAKSEKPSCSMAIDKFFGFDEDKSSFNDLARIVRIFEVADLLKKNTVPGLIKGNMLAHDSEYWFKSWVNYSNDLIKVLKWFEVERLDLINQKTFLEYAVGIILANPRALSCKIFMEGLKRYILWLTITSKSFSKSNLDSVVKLYDNSVAISSNKSMNASDVDFLYSSPNLTALKVQEFTLRRAEYIATCNILYGANPDDLFTHDFLGNKVDLHDLSSFDDHHVFPKACLKNYSDKSKYNSIANLSKLYSKANRLEIKDKLPCDYMGSNKYTNDPSIYCKKNLLDLRALNKIKDPVNDESLIEDFLLNRAEGIADIVNIYFTP